MFFNRFIFKDLNKSIIKFIFAVYTDNKLINNQVTISCGPFNETGNPFNISCFDNVFVILGHSG